MFSSGGAPNTTRVQANTNTDTNIAHTQTRTRTQHEHTFRHRTQTRTQHKQTFRHRARKRTGRSRSHSRSHSHSSHSRRPAGSLTLPLARQPAALSPLCSSPVRTKNTATSNPNSEQNTTSNPNSEHNRTPPEHRTPNTSEHAAEHVQIPNTEHNTEHEHAFSEHRTALFTIPGKCVCPGRPFLRRQSRERRPRGQYRRVLGRALTTYPRSALMPLGLARHWHLIVMMRPPIGVHKEEVSRQMEPTHRKTSRTRQGSFSQGESEGAG